MKKVKIVVRDLRTEISKDLMRKYEEEFLTLKMKEIKQEKEKVEASETKMDLEENFLFAYEEKAKMPKGKALRIKLISEGYYDNSIPTDYQCNICKKYYRDRYGLNKHTKRHYVQINRVPKIIPKREATSEVLRKEIRKCGRLPSFSKFQCKICDRYLTSKCQLRDHIERHYQPATITCEKCKKNFKQNLAAHFCIESLTCPQCHNTYKDVYSLRSHMKRMHKAPLVSKGFSCDYCGDCFSGKRYLKIHFKKCSYNAKKNDDVSYKVKCKICYKILKEKSLKGHMDSSHSVFGEEFKCQKCQKTFKNSYFLNLHMMIHEKRFECKICNQKFSYLRFLKVHMKFHENPEQFRCQICKRQLKDKNDLKKHSKIHNEDLEKDFKCNRCDYKTYLKSALNLHLKYHEGLDERLKNSPNAVKCDQCHSVLKNYTTYLAHRSFMHLNRKKFYCNFCKYSTTTKYHIRIHLESKHF